MSATINDTTTTINTKDVLNELLYLMDTDRQNKENHTCPSLLSLYAKNADGKHSSNNASRGFYDQNGGEKPRNGAFLNVSFCTANGNELQDGKNNVMGTDMKIHYDVRRYRINDNIIRLSLAMNCDGLVRDIKSFNSRV